ncbi:MAG: RDD family protein [Akkermansiaceae bacterium]|nr:RDD family protein [Akkermansiaceae bacterium]
MTEPTTKQAATTPESAAATGNELTASTPVKTPTTAQASLGQRAGAYLIDIGVMIGLSIVISGIVGFALPKIGTLLSLVSWAYLLFRDCIPFLDGRSVGKKLLGLRAVTTDGASLSGNWSPGLIRNAVLFIPFFPLVEFIILCTKQDAPEGLLRLGDQWAGTKVIIDK